jgi:hypothetical protein
VSVNGTFIRPFRPADKGTFCGHDDSDDGDYARGSLNVGVPLKAGTNKIRIIAIGRNPSVRELPQSEDAHMVRALFRNTSLTVSD